MKHERDDDDEDAARTLQAGLDYGTLDHMRKQFKIPNSLDDAGLSNLVSYGEDEEEEEKVTEKTYEYESDEELERSRSSFRRDTEVRKDCPYLDTVNRQVRASKPLHQIVRF